MNYMQYPHGDARAIANARAQGMKPAGAVEVILAGDKIDDSGPNVFVDQDRIYRWDWLVGLNAVLLIDSKTKLDRILADIERAGPSQIDVIDRERRLGWLVLSVKPRIKTVRWPSSWTADWLDRGDWHPGLARDKTNALRAAEAVCKAKPIYEPEVIWN
jgi:hypothetical protein